MENISEKDPKCAHINGKGISKSIPHVLDTTTDPRYDKKMSKNHGVWQQMSHPYN